MRSGLNIFLLIGAIVTNITMSQLDDFDEIVRLRDEMLEVIKGCLAKRSPLETTVQGGLNSAVEITITAGPNTLQTYDDHGNLMHSKSPLAVWVKTTTELAGAISSTEHPPTVATLDYSGVVNRMTVLCDLGKLRCSLNGNTVNVMLIETLIDALQSIILLAEGYETPKSILESSKTKYRTAEEARAKSEGAGTRNIPALLAPEEHNPPEYCSVV
jgi:hypothetical protein